MFLIDAELVYSPQPDGRAENSFTPLIKLSVNGITCLMVLDTGATETLLTRPLADRLGVSLRPSEDGVDHSGRDVPTWVSAQDVTLRIGERSEVLTEAAVIDSPAAFAKMGAGGVLSPQTFCDEGVLVLDFARRRMGYTEDESEESVLRSACFEGLHTAALRRVRLSGEEAALLVVKARAPGGGAIDLMVNSGAWEAELAPKFAPRLSSGAGSYGKGLSGARIHAQIVRDLALDLDGATIPACDVLVRSQPKGLGGQIGMESLKAMSLMIPPAGDTLYFGVPAHWATR